MITILFLAANPTDATRLRLDKESRAIDQALRLAEFRDSFDLRQHWAVRVADLQGLLLRHRPDIVHFSGHGSQDNEIVLEDQTGRSQPVPARALTQLFSVLKDNVRCVVLNACYSGVQAQAIAQHIDCVVGMSDAIGDQAAISFAAAFYQALGYGRDVKTAFDLGCVQIDMENLRDQDVPQLLATKRSPSEIFLVSDKTGSSTGKQAEDQLSGTVADKPQDVRGSSGVSFGNISGDVKDNIIAGRDITHVRKGETTVFDQRGQQVNYQYNAAGDINFGKNQELEHQLTTGNADARAQAAVRAGERPYLLPLSTLSKCLSEDTDPTVRYYLAIAIGKIGGEDAVAILQAATKSETNGFALLGITEGLQKANSSDISSPHSS